MSVLALIPGFSPGVFAQSVGDAVFPALGSLAVGAAVWILARMITYGLASEDARQEAQWRHDVNRINELRRTSFLYRSFQPLIHALAAFNRGVFADSLPEIGRQVQAAGFSRLWTPAEYLARLQLLGLLAAPLYFSACLTWFGDAGAILAIVLTGLTIYGLRRRLAGQAEHRLFLIKKRLPYLLDLLTLLMEAGSTFLQSLKEAANEFRDQPVGVEFGRVLTEMGMGKSRTEALNSLRHRLSDDEITSIVGSIIQGEELGTPLAILFRTQADVLRIKRTQRAETIAGEAGVKMLLPAILVMMATVIIILGPFILSFLYADLMS
jgi:tight adherence protein C